MDLSTCCYSPLLESNLLQLTGMLLCIIVVVCLFIRGYHSSRDESDSKDVDRQKLHKYYISGILVFIIIELVTGICMRTEGADRILSYINFAATLSSLILSVVAIIYSIVNSRKGEEQYGKIDKASGKIDESLKDFSSKALEMSDKINAFEGTVSSIKDLTINLDGKLQDAIERLKHIDDTTTQFKETFNFHGDQINNKADNPVPVIPLEQVNSFVNHGSFLGNLAVLACVLSKESNHPFKLKDISNNDEKNFAYIYGYIFSSMAIGIIVGRIVCDECTVEKVPDGLKDSLEARIKKQISNIKERKQHRQDYYDLVVNLFKQA